MRWALLAIGCWGWLSVGYYIGKPTPATTTKVDRIANRIVFWLFLILAIVLVVWAAK